MQRIVDGTQLYRDTIDLIDRLRAEVAALKEENERRAFWTRWEMRKGLLKDYVRGLLDCASVHA